MKYAYGFFLWSIATCVLWRSLPVLGNNDTVTTTDPSEPSIGECMGEELLQTELSTVRGLLTDCQTDVTTFSDAVTDWQSKWKALHELGDEQNRQLTAYEERLSACRTQLSDSRNFLMERDMELSEAVQSVETCQIDNDNDEHNYQMEIRELNQQMQALGMQVTRGERRLEDSTSQYYGAIDIISNLRKTLAEDQKYVNMTLILNDLIIFLSRQINNVVDWWDRKYPIVSSQLQATKTRTEQWSRTLQKFLRPYLESCNENLFPGIIHMQEKMKCFYNEYCAQLVQTYIGSPWRNYGSPMLETLINGLEYLRVSLIEVLEELSRIGLIFLEEEPTKQMTALQRKLQQGLQYVHNHAEKCVSQWGYCLLGTVCIVYMSRFIGRVIICVWVLFLLPFNLVFRFLHQCFQPKPTLNPNSKLFGLSHPKTTIRKKDNTTHIFA